MRSAPIFIFTDGSSRGNPGPGGFAAVMVLPSGMKGGEAYVIETGGRENKTTNNRMELAAIREALNKISYLRVETHGITVYSDSRYVINGMTSWVSGWKKNGWKTKDKKDVLNRDLWEDLDRLFEKFKVSFEYVGGHVGISGNERADYLATAFADGNNPNLFEGPLSKYPLPNVLNISKDALLSEKKTKSKDRSNVKAYSYVSSIKGHIKIHRTWAECEERVKGMPGARFRKAVSPEDEEEIVARFRNL